MTDEQWRRANHEGVEHVLSRGERRRLEKKLESKRCEKLKSRVSRPRMLILRGKCC